MLCLGTELSLTLCRPMDCSPQAPLPMEILQAGILEWIVMPFSRNDTHIPLNIKGKEGLLVKQGLVDTTC